MTHGPTPRPGANGCNQRGGTLRPDRKWADIRASLGLSIRDFAGRVGINHGQLSKIENGQACPTPDEAHRILIAYQELKP